MMVLVDDSVILRGLWGAGTPLWTVLGVDILKDAFKVQEDVEDACLSVSYSIRIGLGDISIKIIMPCRSRLLQHLLHILQRVNDGFDLAGELHGVGFP